MIHSSRRARFNADNDPMWQTAEILKGLISPAPAQLLVAPPPDTPPPTQPDQGTPLTRHLATAPTQAKPRHEPALAKESAASTTPADPHSRVRHGLAAYFLGRIGQKETQPQPDQKNVTFLFRRLPKLQPSPRTTTSSSPVNQLLSGAARGAAKKWMPQAGANADGQKHKMAQVQADSSLPDRSRDPRYVKVQSKGQIGYLPKSNLERAKKRDRTLKVLG
jgi:hypothetical protein